MLRLPQATDTARSASFKWAFRKLTVSENSTGGKFPVSPFHNRYRKEQRFSFGGHALSLELSVYARAGEKRYSMHTDRDLIGVPAEISHAYGHGRS
jgi:hypothetical protein